MLVDDFYDQVDIKSFRGSLFRDSRKKHPKKSEDCYSGQSETH